MSAARHVFEEGHGLRLHLLQWGEGERVILLLHGFLEHAHAWDHVAPRLAAAGYRVYALDWRGHGDSEWIGRGGYYHFIDYVADLSFLVPRLGERVALVGHSMGSGAALLYAGTEPERVSHLVAIEGLGAPAVDPGGAPERVVAWLDDLRRNRARAARTPQPDEAIARMAERFPGLGRDAACHLVEHNLRDVDGVPCWKFDPLHQTRAPLPLPEAQARAFWRRIGAPVLFVGGEASFLPAVFPDLDERLAELRARRASLAGVGHHPHLEQPEALAQLLLSFFAEKPRRVARALA